MRSTHIFAVAAAAALISPLLVVASPPADWLTDGGDPQRTGWQRNETILNKDNVKNLKLRWKVKLDNEPREMHSLFPPMIASGIPTHDGFKEIAIEAGSSDNIYGIDTATGKVLWEKHFTYKAEKPQRKGGGPLCPAGLVVTPTIGLPGPEGQRTAYAVSGDGRMHFLNVADGEDVQPPADFMPPNGKAYSLNLWKNVLYSTTAQSCGGNPNMVYAFDLATRKMTRYNPKGGGLWGRSGAAIGFDGTLYAPTGDGQFDPAAERYGEAIIAVNPNMTLKDYYAPSNAAFMWKRDLDMQVTPTVFKYKDHEFVVSSSKECRIWLMDAKSIGGADHRTPLYRTPQLCNEDINFAAAGVWGSMATWEDAKGTRWVLTSFWGPVHSQFKPPLSYGPVTRGAVVAHKVEEIDGKFVLTPVWISHDMDMAEPPIIANGVVYAYGSGESNVQATPELGLAANSSAIRIKNSTHAIIYAFDGETGKELWSSGDAISTFVHFGALSIANGHIYLGAFDSTLYSFGLKGE
ncbi:MAG TPA: PQQ-binding-like beta-propeller repeat protein [Bryobacteraceae bacterium]|jgi:outer membrane protein assembly factor BamB